MELVNSDVDTLLMYQWRSGMLLMLHANELSSNQIGRELIYLNNILEFISRFIIYQTYSRIWLDMLSIYHCNTKSALGVS